MTNLEKIEELILQSGIRSMKAEDINKVMRTELQSDYETKFDFAITQFKKYIFHKRVEFVGRDEKYIAKEDKPKDFVVWLRAKGWKQEYPFPTTTFTKAMRVNGTFYEDVEKERKISERLKKQAEIKKQERMKKHGTQY